LFWKKRPEYSDQALNELSATFFTDSQDPTFGLEHLKAERLDYSIESLAEINSYLEVIRSDPNVKEVWNKVVLRCGAYVGEVIRRNSNHREYHWIDYKNALKVDEATFEKFGYVIGTAAVLYSEGPSFCFPLAKVEKYLLNGPEDDVQFFAESILAQAAQS
jgi:hypothetical protein